MPTENECSSSQLKAIETSDFCEKSFCPAANAAWPYELDALCRPLVAPGFFGNVLHSSEVPSVVRDFCESHRDSIVDEGQSHITGPDKEGFPTDRPGPTKGCLFSVLYSRMLDRCQDDKCLKRTWACLVPNSYCERVGNEENSIPSTMKYFGDTAGLIDTSQVKRFDDEHACNQFCLSSPSAGLPAVV